MRIEASQLLGRVRLATGLVLFFYVLTHNLNHALGLISLEAMDWGRIPFLAFWRFPPIEILLFLSLATHLALGLRALYNRHSLRMPFWEGAQLVLGISIPPLLTLHVLGTVVAHQVFGLDDAYEETVLALATNGTLVAVQTAAVIVTWIHGCIGLGFWLRLRPWFPKARVALFVIALLIPILALLGFAEAAREVLRLAQEPGWFHGLVERRHIPGREASDLLYLWLDIILTGYAVILIGLLFGRYLRDWLIRHRAIRVAYANGKTVSIQPGSTILEASRIGNIPHAAVCGGQGRCSTCRVRVNGPGALSLPPPDAAEQKVLERIMAPPGVRLACQIRPTGDIAVTPLLPAGVPPKVVYGAASHAQGAERRIAILFADLRGFTKLSESRLPYDVVFLLNQYFKAMGEAVEAAGGRLDKFIGDGVMALFGIEEGPDTGCRRALDAARRMSAALAQLNRALEADLGLRLKIGIGIHCGPAIIGEMGHGSAMNLTAIGDAVNTASRLESATKEFGAELVVSEEVALRGGLLDGEHPGWTRATVSLRGKSEPLGVLVAEQAAMPLVTATGD